MSARPQAQAQAPAQAGVQHQTLAVVVRRKRLEANDICSLELLAAGDQALPAFAAGAHVDVHLPGGLIRQYSLCNDPAERGRYLIAVLREPASRGGSTAVHDAIREGDRLSISPPKNHFALATDAGPSLLLAGGIGVTPILAMAEQLQADGRDFRFHYAARSPARAAFVERVRAGPFAARTQFHFDDGEAAQRLDLDQVLGQAAPGTHLYVCGPKGFIDAVLDAARRRGWDPARLHWEYFAGEAVVPRADDGSFDVCLASSGRVVRIAADQSIVAALAEAGIEIAVSCEQGICGTCLTRVLDGEPDHRDAYLTPEEQAANDQFTPCCSRSKSARLVLDL